LRKRSTKLPREGWKVLRGAAIVAGWVVIATAAAATGDDALRETAACLDCHEDAATGLAGGPHMVRLADEPTRVFCSDCHAGVAAHWEDDPAANPLANPAGMDVAEAAKVCSGCHIDAHQENQAKLSPHALNGVTCLACHTVHGESEDHLLKEAQPELCFGCHGATRGDFAKPYRHFAGEHEFMKCSDCHLKTDDRLAELSAHDKNAACFACHAEFQGPFPHDHQAAVDYSTEEGGCLNCHDPHGSYVPRLLKQPYEPPHYQLCSQCHVVPKHRSNTQHGDEWADVSCTECHVDIHGSYTNKLFLTTALEAQGCFAAGCHSR